MAAMHNTVAIEDVEWNMYPLPDGCRMKVAYVNDAFHGVEQSEATHAIAIEGDGHARVYRYNHSYAQALGDDIRSSPGRFFRGVRSGW